MHGNKEKENLTMLLLLTLKYRCYRVVGVITFVISLLATVLLKEKKSATSPKKANYRNMLDLSVCKDPKFIIWCVAGNLSMLSYFIPAFYLPSHATKIGLKPSQGSILVALFSAVNVAGRIISGYSKTSCVFLRINTYFT